MRDTWTFYAAGKTHSTAGTGYLEVDNARVDTHGQGYRSIAYSVALPTSNYAAVVKVQGRISEDDDGDWVDLKAFDETGSQYAAADVDIAAGGRKYLIVPLTGVSGALAAFRQFRVMAKAKNSSADTHVRVRAFAK